MREPPDTLVIAAIAAEIKLRRSQLKISQEELAHRASVHRSFIARLEIGSTQPSTAALFRLAKALELDVEVLVAGIAKRYRRVTRLHSKS
jgi:transcriptional regulator with XRE-family HTH domain